MTHESKYLMSYALFWITFLYSESRPGSELLQLHTSLEVIQKK